MLKTTVPTISFSLTILFYLTVTTIFAQNYIFDDWARNHGYSPGDAMPENVDAAYKFSDDPYIDSIDEFRWITTRRLYLTDNRIGNIDPVVGLWLGGQQISSIEDTMFNGLTDTLEQLDLSFNHITSIESNDFDAIPNLTYLGLHNSQISNIEPNSFNIMYLKYCIII